ncbi:MAG: hypothetical protein CM1200mP35_00650 [Chloroflexota bacterium]|nr:MAG: hypothetical protein CM1200mP35_00650 [Chloroflexota bacterium]
MTTGLPPELNAKKIQYPKIVRDECQTLELII